MDGYNIEENQLGRIVNEKDESLVTCEGEATMVHSWTERLFWLIILNDSGVVVI